jgi:hypothetical protein
LRRAEVSTRGQGLGRAAGVRGVRHCRAVGSPALSGGGPGITATKGKIDAFRSARAERDDQKRSGRGTVDLDTRGEGDRA